MSSAAVTAGGAQDAKDGGLDVRVACGDTIPSGYIPRADTGFQVKLTDMPPSAIAAEMRPGGKLRLAIGELARQGGAYIMVVAKGTVADSALAARRAAMHAAVADDPNGFDLHVDFYDRDRLARWARSYPGVTAWVLHTVGRGIAGWRPVEALTSAPPGSPFLLDEDCKIFDGRAADAPLTLADGIDRMRAALRVPRATLRLVGLSGLGKTRLVEGLFEQGVGTAPLERGIAIYADQAAEPDPSPRQMAASLARDGVRAILVVDNCNPPTHRALAEACRAPGSMTSLITVEYDVRDDEPESTDVFRLEPASQEVLERLLELRMPGIGEIDRRRIADLAGGNFRIALALAATVKPGVSLGTLSDTELFERLFIQRNPDDHSLLEAARVLSIVYSFDGVVTDPASELAALAALAGQNVGDLFRHVAELEARGLVQRRSSWRAVLPHALANRLAAEGYRRLPPPTLDRALTSAAKERLLKSAAHRLSFLHDSNEARATANRWLSSWFPGNIGKLSDLGSYLLRNLAPVVPAETLSAIETAARESEDGKFFKPGAPHGGVLKTIVHHIAYDAATFRQAALLLAEFLAAEPPKHNNNSIRHDFAGLFHMRLSFTEASPMQRREVVDTLLRSPRKDLREVGLVALQALFEAGHFSSAHQGDFGARSRGYGWTPRTSAEVVRWVADALALARDHIARSADLAGRIRDIVAASFRILWLNTKAWQELEAAADALAPWPEGWIAARATLSIHRQDMPDEALARLEGLAERLAPRDLMEEFAVYVLERGPVRGDLTDAEAEDSSTSESFSNAFARTAERARALGRSFARRPDLLVAVAVSLCDGTAERPVDFGEGLADSEEPRTTWRMLVDAMARLPEGERWFGAVAGFIRGLSAAGSPLRDELLEEAVSDPVLERGFPIVQSATTLDAVALDRLDRAIDRGTVAPAAFRAITYQDVSAALEPRFAALIGRIATLDQGPAIAISLLEARFRASDKQGNDDLPSAYVATARTILATIDFTDETLPDYGLERLTKRCAAGEVGKPVAAAMMVNLKRALEGGGYYRPTLENTIRALIKAQPRLALEQLMVARPDGERDYRYERMFGWFRANPLQSVPDEIWFAWLDENVAARLLPAARVIRLFPSSAENGKLTGAFVGLYRRCTDKAPLLEIVQDRLHPNSYSGSLNEIVTARVAALTALMSDDPDPVVQAWLVEVRGEAERRLAAERSAERVSDERFE